MQRHSQGSAVLDQPRLVPLQIDARHRGDGFRVEAVLPQGIIHQLPDHRSRRSPLASDSEDKALRNQPERVIKILPVVGGTDVDSQRSSLLLILRAQRSRCIQLVGPVNALGQFSLHREMCVKSYRFAGEKGSRNLLGIGHV